MNKYTFSKNGNPITATEVDGEVIDIHTKFKRVDDTGGEKICTLDYVEEKVEFAGIGDVDFDPLNKTFGLPPIPVIEEDDLFPHQRHALTEMVGVILDSDIDRGQILLPTGSGKSRVFFRCAIDNKFPIYVISAPSISLVRQLEFEFKTYAEKFNVRHDFDYQIVNSDSEMKDDILDGNSDIEYYEKTATTDATVVAEQISSSEKLKRPLMVFSTHHSLAKVGKALLMASSEADVLVYDEGHRAGDKTGDIYTTLENEYFPAKNRLFFTATRRLFKTNTTEKHEYAMDRVEYYGEVIVDYKPRTLMPEYIVVPAILGLSFDSEYAEEVKKLVESSDRTKTISEDLKNEIILNIAGLAKVYEETGKIKNISFAQSIDVANWYAEQTDFIIHIIELLLGKKIGKVDTFVIDQKVVGYPRVQMLKNFSQAKNAFLYNYQVIKEGIDIKDCNCVTLMRKMDSIGIMQSIGRALRKSEGKTCGYVLCPINIDSKRKGESIERLRNVAIALFEEGYSDIIVDEANVHHEDRKLKRRKELDKISLIVKDLEEKGIIVGISNTEIETYLIDVRDCDDIADLVTLVGNDDLSNLF